MASTQRKRALVFSDLDGTLLDHDSYSFEPARPALAELARRGVPVILSSSKTLAEMQTIREAMDLAGPFIFENGAGVAVPPELFPEADDVEQAQGFRLRRFGCDRQRILETLAGLRREGYGFEGFADWDDAETARRTGLSLEAATRAGRRTASEPFLFLDDRERFEAFRDRLDAEGLRVVRGGRFWCAMGRFDKADGMRWVREQYALSDPESELLTVALGDSPNDEGMLGAADIAVVIRSRRSAEVVLDEHGRVMRTEAPGPAGWREAIEALLPELAAEPS